MCSFRRPSIFRMGGRYSSSERGGGTSEKLSPTTIHGGRKAGVRGLRPLTMCVLQGLDHIWVKCRAHQHLHIAPVHFPHRPGLQQTPRYCPLWGEKKGDMDPLFQLLSPLRGRRSNTRTITLRVNHRYHHELSLASQGKLLKVIQAPNLAIGKRIPGR